MIQVLLSINFPMRSFRDLMVNRQSLKRQRVNPKRRTSQFVLLVRSEGRTRRPKSWVLGTDSHPVLVTRCRILSIEHSLLISLLSTAVKSSLLYSL